MADTYITKTILKKELEKSNTKLRVELRDEMKQFSLDQEARIKGYVDEVAQLILKSVSWGFEEVHAELRLIRKDVRTLAEKVEKHEQFFIMLTKKFSDLS